MLVYAAHWEPDMNEESGERLPPGGDCTKWSVGLDLRPVDVRSVCTAVAFADAVLRHMHLLPSPGQDAGSC
jgi:hypothetical protein